jgi:hypothetical protein
MEPRRHPVIVLICFALVTNSIFAACPTHTGAPPEEAPHFDLQNYATGDWFGLRNTLYDYGIEVTGGYTTEPAGNPVGGIEHGFTYLHNFGFGVLFDLQKIAGISIPCDLPLKQFNHRLRADRLVFRQACQTSKLNWATTNSRPIQIRTLEAPK